jgi:hypothetical protein
MEYALTRNPALVYDSPKALVMNGSSALSRLFVT